MLDKIQLKLYNRKKKRKKRRVLKKKRKLRKSLKKRSRNMKRKKKRMKRFRKEHKNGWNGFNLTKTVLLNQLRSPKMRTETENRSKRTEPSIN